MQTVSSTMMLSERLIAVDGASQPAEAPPRVELLDNAKAVLIICVVLYHTAVVCVSCPGVSPHPPASPQCRVRGFGPVS